METEEKSTTTTMTMEWVWVTPELAGEWLGMNQKNRHESPHRIRRYAADQENGDWKDTHQAIAFDEDDFLADGQNRLLMVQRTKIAQGFWVCRNVPRDAFFVMDTGKPRSLADALTIDGETNARNIAAGTNLLWRVTEGLDENGLPAPSNPGTARAREFWKPRKHGLREAIPAMNHVYYYLRGPNSAYTAMYYRFAEVAGTDDADWFYDRLAVGTHMKDNDPILRLRNHILHFRSSDSMHHLDRIHIAGLMTKAFNLYREGKTTRQLTWKRGGASPEPFPEVI